jgi:hypothetical protein
MMLPEKESADVGRLLERLKKLNEGEITFKYMAAVAEPWSVWLVDTEDMLSEAGLSLAATGTTFSEALAKLSKLVYEESLTQD